MPEPRKKWSLRRMRRRWNDSVSALSLRWRIWFDQHILSHQTRRRWARRFRRRSDKMGRAVENVGFKVIPHRPDADPDSGWSGFAKKFDAFVDERIYPPERREQHFRFLRQWWPQFTSPFRHANTWMRHAIDEWLMPVLTPAGFRKRLVNWRGAAMLAGVLALVTFAAFWLLPQWRTHNNQKWTAQARLLLGRGYSAMAQQNALRVIRRDERNEDATRIFADLRERQGGVDAIYWRRKAVEISPSVTNRLALATTAIKFEAPPSSTAARIIAEVKTNSVGNVQYHVAVAEFHARNNKWSDAEAEYALALEADSANAETRLSLALARMRGGPSQISSANELLIHLSTQTNTAVRALRALTSLAVARSDLDAALDLSKRILSEDGSNFDDRLAHLHVLTRRRDPERGKFLRLLQEQIGSNPFYIAQLATWMTANHEADDVLTWLDRLPPAIRKSDPVLLSKADAYAAMSDWRGLEKFLLDERSWGTIEFLRQTMLARAYRGQGDHQAFRSNFGRASELAGGMAARLAKLTRTVADWGWNQEADELLWMIFDGHEKETWAGVFLERRHLERGDTAGLQRLYTKQLARDTTTNNFYLMNNVAMTSLLLRKELPAAHKLALRGYKEQPSFNNTSTYAYSLHVQGQTPEARQVLESLGIEALKVPSIAPYYVIITHALGDTATARRHLEYARLAQNLLPEEKAMLAAAREKL